MSISGGNEIFRRLSSQIEMQFPGFIREEGPNFVAFLKAYYEYLEQTGNAIDASRGLYDYADIDRTLNSFITYFQKEFLVNIPKTVLANKRLLAKYIREFYRSRGSQESYRFLFRILFDEEIDFYYPGEDILRASDGRWVRETIIRGLADTGNPLFLDGRQITGQTSGATARVQEVLQILSLGLTLNQLTVENVVGTFVENEVVSDGFGNSIRIFNASGSISSATVTRGGAFHVVGDSITLTGSSGGFATGKITGTTDTSGVTFKILNGGSGYRVNSTITISGGNPTTPAQFTIVDLSDTEVISVNTDVISTAANVILNTNPFAVGATPFSTANINTALNAALSFANQTVGSINTIQLTEPGSGYTSSLPAVTVSDDEIFSQAIPDPIRGGTKGRNAAIIAQKAFGSVTRVTIEGSDTSFFKNDNITLTNTSRSPSPISETYTDQIGGNIRTTVRNGTYPATVNANILGTFQLPGRYISTKGFLSWNCKLQDNEYYQEFSYVIRTKRILEQYQNVVLNVLHPAGYKMFGMNQNETLADLSSGFGCDAAIITTPP